MSPTVVVADDSQTIRQVVQMALKAEPFEVVGVGSAQEAVDAAQGSPSVLLLDYHLPDGSGYEVCQALKSDGSTASVPVIMLGGTHRNFDEAKARQSGADEVVMKPFKTDTLLNAIDAVASGEAQSAEAAQATPPAQPPTSGGDSSSGSRPRMSVDESSGPRQAPTRDGSGSKPRFRQPADSGGSQPRIPDSGSQPRIPDSGSQPRIPDSGSQPGAGGSQPRISTPDVNASTRAQNVSGAADDAAGPGATGSTGDSGVSNIGMSRAEIEKTIEQKVKVTVKEQLPGLLRNIMGEVFQQKVLPKLMEHGEHRVEAMVNDQLSEQIREAVRVEIERLLAEE